MASSSPSPQPQTQESVVSPPVSLTHRLVKSEDLNPHGTLFAGRLASWLIETCWIAARRCYSGPEDVVCVNVHDLTVNKPVRNGEVLEVRAEVARLGSSSITVFCHAVKADGSAEERITGLASFVTVSKDGKPYKHGMRLSDDYIASHKKIYDIAVAASNSKKA